VLIGGFVWHRLGQGESAGKMRSEHAVGEMKFIRRVLIQAERAASRKVLIFDFKLLR
jgi:hypothetical protein